MATKAELEKELAEMRRELAAAREAVAEADPSNGTDDDAGKPEEDRSTLGWALSRLDGTEIDRLFKQFSAELEDMQENKPLMTLFGAFLLGYVLGRSQ